jgi:cytochrome c-type biogenesis protein CcmH/NrfF
VLIPGTVLSVAAGFLALREPDPRAVPSLQDVSDRTISPYCAPLTLSECPSGKASELRAEIDEKIRSGWTNARIDAWLVTNFGTWLVGNPGDSVAKLFPALTILVGAIVMAVFMGRRSGSQPGIEREDPPLEPNSSEIDQIRRELAEFRSGSE